MAEGAIDKDGQLISSDYVKDVRLCPEICVSLFVFLGEWVGDGVHV